MSIDRDPFPVDSLPDPMRGFVDSVARATGTDPSFAALAALVCAAGAIGNRVAALVKGGWTEPSVLWGAMVARSGAIKSPVMKLAKRPFIAIFKKERAAFGEAMREFKIEAARHEAAAKQHKADGGDPAALPAAPKAPVQKRTLVSDCTIEKLGSLLDANPLGLLLVRDELAAWLGSFDRYASGKGSDSASWLSLNDAADVQIDRKTTSSHFIDRGAVSVLGSIQPRILERVFGQAERESGLLARVLLVHPPDRAARWSDDELRDGDADACHNLIIGLADLQHGTDSDGAPCPRFLPLTTEARSAFVQWHEAHMAEVESEADEDLHSHLAKLKGHCIRFALIFEAVAAATGRGRGTCIGLDALRRAMIVTDWFKSEARRVYSTLGESDEARLDRLVLEHVQKIGNRATVRELQRAGPLTGRTADDIELLLAALVKRGLGRWEPIPAPPGGGKPSRYFVVSDDNRRENPQKNERLSVVSCQTAAEAAPQNDQPEPAEGWAEL